MKTTTTLQNITSKLFILVAFILCAANTAVAQKQIEIVIVASSHQNPGPAENYRYIVDKLKNYKPDMVFSEFLSPDDLKEAIAQNYYGAKADVKKRNFLLSKNDKAPKNLPKEIAKAYTSLDKFDYYHKTRMELARNLYLNYDKANAEYQFYVLEQHMQQKFGEKEQALFNKMFGGADSLRKVGLIRKNSEYQKIYFPLINELGHDKIYAADCQKYDADWNKAWQNALEKSNVMKATAKADSTSKEAAAVKAISKFVADATERMKGIDYTSYEFLNSELYAELDEHVNFLGGPRFFNEPGFITEEVKLMLHWWEKRNQGICENIIRQAKEKGATRVVVGVGSSHRKGMEEIFAQMPNVKLVNYNDLP